MTVAIAIIADDLSGAAETVGAVAGGAFAELRLMPAATPSTAPVVAIDTNTRGRSQHEAQVALREALATLPAGAVLYKKIDSLLRGNLSSEVALLRALSHRIVVVTAVPRVGRTSVGGVVHLDGVPLHETSAWEHETRPAPSSTAAALGVPSTVISAATVRSADLGAAMLEAFAADLVAVCDAETEADLELIAAALDPRATIVAAAGLARALAPRFALAAGVPRFAPGADRVVTVVGSQAPSAISQVECMDAVWHCVVPGAAPDLGAGDAVVTLAPGEWAGDDLVRAFTAIARSIRGLPGRTDLVLTGGDTARRVLDALGVVSLFPEYEIQDGAVLSCTDNGFVVVTRPGSYGAEDGLQRIVEHLRGTA
ncbi:four-carbon acid sugar kinase family protein [Naasia aerilata]|uniref:Four-carbon acid sugar kinase family protein n=1 Tax=Naasia aerilata TaxID=1162966 RepID=A0ABM8GBC0_9MICO|nr:four-carbon acid sugar kinase family protein [Naasia aerilata]BDZ45516.1 hypothetical protein GCM10025866_14250 [Naasia aerilata]